MAICTWPSMREFLRISNPNRPGNQTRSSSGNRETPRVHLHGGWLQQVDSTWFDQSFYSLVDWQNLALYSNSSAVRLLWGTWICWLPVFEVSCGFGCRQAMTTEVKGRQALIISSDETCTERWLQTFGSETSWHLYSGMCRALHFQTVHRYRSISTCK